MDLSKPDQSVQVAVIGETSDGQEDEANVPTKPMETSSCWNPFHDIRVFIANIMIINISSIGLLAANVGSLRTLEKRFGLTATESGFFQSVNDVTNICLVMIVGMIGRKCHKPRFLGILVLIGGIGAIMYASPYVFFPLEDTAVNSTKHEQDSTIYCGKDEAAAMCERTESQVESNRSAYAVLVTSLLLVALSNVGLMAVSTTYIDENCPEDKTSLYLGVANSAWSLGPVVGFLAAGVLLGEPENLRDSPVGPEDPAFIGCWWLVPLLFGVVLVASAIILMFFPKHMEHYYIQKRKKKQQALKEGKKPEEFQKEEKKQTTKEFIIEKLKENLKAVFRLLRNPTYMALVVSTICQWFLIQYSIQMSKYMELQFHVSAMTASIINGISGSLMAAVGLILVGVLASRLHWRIIQFAKGFLVGSIVVVVLTVALWPFSCNQPVIEAQTDGPSAGLCAADCSCSADNTGGVCVQNTLSMYPTACYAGCKNYLGNETYSGCSCLPSGGEVLTTGLCGVEPCNSYIPYAVVAALGSLAGGFIALGQILLSLRLIDDDLKTIALSFTSFLSSAFVFIPGPLIFGGMFDSVCDLWETSCGERRNCLIYDMDKYRHYLHGLTGGIIGVGAVFAVIMYALLLRQIRRGEIRVTDQPEDTESVASSQIIRIKL